MSSINVTLTGDSSSLSTHFQPEIKLDERFNYSCCLLEFSTQNFMWNEGSSDIDNDGTILVEEGKNNVGYVYTFGILERFGVITVPPGKHKFAYIAAYIAEEMAAKGKKDSNVRLTLDRETMKCSLKTGGKDFRVDFSVWNSIAGVLGFEERIYENGGMAMRSITFNNDSTVIDTVRIDCDLVQTGVSFHNGIVTHTLHEFSPSETMGTTTVLGYKMIEQPKNLIYLPVTQRHINTLNVTILDQNNRPINFRANSNNKKKNTTSSDTPPPPPPRVKCIIHLKQQQRRQH